MTGFKRSLTETEWRHLGLQMGKGWQNYEMYTRAEDMIQKRGALHNVRCIESAPHGGLCLSWGSAPLPGSAPAGSPETNSDADETSALQLMEDLTQAIHQRESVKLQVNETQAELLALKRQA